MVALSNDARSFSRTKLSRAFTAKDGNPILGPTSTAKIGRAPFSLLILNRDANIKNISRKSISNG